MTALSIDRMRAAQALFPHWYRDARLVLWVITDLAEPHRLADLQVKALALAAAREAGWFQVVRALRRR